MTTTPRMTAAELQRLHGPKAPAPTTVLGCAATGKVKPSGPTAGTVKGRDAGPTEKEVQRQIVMLLRQLGYTVHETSQRRASGVSIGLADLFVTKRGWGVWLALECKRNEKSRLSPEQMALVDAGMIHIVWSAQMALDVVRKGRGK